MIVSYKDLFWQYQQIEVTWVLENIIQQYQYELSELEKGNRKLEKENFVMKDRLKFWYKWVTREEIERVEEENRKLKHKNELQEKALIRLCLKHHYDSIIIEWEEVIDMSNYKVVEKKKPQEEKLF